MTMIGYLLRFLLLTVALRCKHYEFYDWFLLPDADTGLHKFEASFFDEDCFLLYCLMCPLVLCVFDASVCLCVRCILYVCLTLCVYVCLMYCVCVLDSVRVCVPGSVKVGDSFQDDLPQAFVVSGGTERAVARKKCRILNSISLCSVFHTFCIFFGVRSAVKDTIVLCSLHIDGMCIARAFQAVSTLCSS